MNAKKSQSNESTKSENAKNKTDISDKKSKTSTVSTKKTEKPINNNGERTQEDINVVQKHYNREVWAVTSKAAIDKIQLRAKQLEKISAEIIASVDVAHEEKEAHKYLTTVLEKLDCKVHSSYIHPTGFKAIYTSSSVTEHMSPPTVGLICEYDAIRGFGHSRGNNLMTEATIGAFIGVREAMKVDTRLVGRVVIVGTPASEELGGKIQMMKEGAFDKIDAIVAITPSNYNCLTPRFYCSQKTRISFAGTARHMDCMNTILSRNAVDAAVICYNNIKVLSNNTTPDCQIHCLIKRCGDVDYMVPKKSELICTVRAPTLEQLDALNGRLVDCGESAAQATQTTADFHFFNDDMYSYVNHNKVLANVFREEANRMGINFDDQPLSTDLSHRATDLGNVSHKIPLICPAFAIGGVDAPPVHSIQFSESVAKSYAQHNTLNVSTIMSLTIIKYLLNQNIREEVRKQFQMDAKALEK